MTMTMMPVKDGVFRAYAPSDSRGRRKRRGEFLPVGLSGNEYATARVPVRRTEGEVVSPLSSAKPAAETEAVTELRIQHDESGDGTMTLLVSGTLDLSTVLPFRDAVFTAIGGKPRTLVVDVSCVRDIDTAGISALVTAGRVARLMQVPFSVTPSPSLRALLEKTGICRTVPVTESLPNSRH